MTAIIVDDCKLNLEIIASAMKEVCPEVKIMGKALTLEKAESLILELKPDLVLLDIMMHGVESFELLAKLAKLKNYHFNFVPIFITCHGKAAYQTQAINFSDIDFIIKPIRESDVRLRRAINRAEECIIQKNAHSKIDTLNESIRTKDNPLFWVNLVQGGKYPIRLLDIACLKSKSNHTLVYLKNKEEPLEATNLLKYFEEDLLQGLPFLRIHNQYIVNLTLILIPLDKNKSNPIVRLDTNYKLEARVGRNNWNSLQEALSNLL